MPATARVQLPERIIHRPQRLDLLAMQLQALACMLHSSTIRLRRHHDPNISSRRFQASVQGKQLLLIQLPCGGGQPRP